jgi:hypothetical protein
MGQESLSEQFAREFMRAARKSPALYFAPLIVCWKFLRATMRRALMR